MIATLDLNVYVLVFLRISMNTLNSISILLFDVCDRVCPCSMLEAVAATMPMIGRLFCRFRQGFWIIQGKPLNLFFFLFLFLIFFLSPRRLHLLHTYAGTLYIRVHVTSTLTSYNLCTRYRRTNKKKRLHDSCWGGMLGGPPRLDLLARCNDRQFTSYVSHWIMWKRFSFSFLFFSFLLYICALPWVQIICIYLYILILIIS